MRRPEQIKIISFTGAGNTLNIQLQKELAELGYICRGYTMKQTAEKADLMMVNESLQSWAGKEWGRSALLFIGAAGIAVRSIAPWIEDKYSDPAVITADEKGQYIIPLLSGHMGKAVDIARVVAGCTGGTAIVTTATDIRSKFAVDVFARDNDLEITDRQIAKEISASILENGRIGFYSEYPFNGDIPLELVVCPGIDNLKDYAQGAAVVKRVPDEPKNNILYLRPIQPDGIIVGVGCRRNTMMGRLEAVLDKLLVQYGLTKDDIICFASIDLKKDEQGILKLAEAYKVPLYTYTADQLNAVETASAGSQFVKQVAGVDNVCERAACYCCPEGELLQPKTVIDGIALALVRKKMILSF